MQMRWIRVPRSRSLERAAIDVSPKARQRLRWFDYYRAHEGNAALERFKREAKAASALNHPNIITIHDIDEAEGVHYIAMEHVGGKTLDRLMARHGLRVNETLKYAVQMAAALAKAHSAGRSFSVGQCWEL
jgi:serine/threonine protein kinase